MTAAPLVPDSVLYLCYDGHLESPIIRTQVLDVLTHLVGPTAIRLVCWEDPRRHARYLPHKPHLASTLEIVRYPRLPSAPGLLIESLRVARVAAGRRWDVVHCRGIKAGTLGVALRRLGFARRVVVDMRGDEVAEARARWEQGHRYREWVEFQTLRMLWPRVLNASDAVTCVSPALSELVKASMGHRARLTTTIPTCSGLRLTKSLLAVRSELRRVMDLESSIVLVYSGGTQEYQGLDYVMRFFRELNTRDSSFRLLRAVYGESRSEEVGAPGVTYLDNSTHASVADIMACADLGIMLRPESPVNYVAAPVKHAEYCCMGLPEVVNRACALAYERVMSTGAGFVLEGLSPQALDAFERWARGLSPDPAARMNRSRDGLETYSVEAVAARYSGLWSEVCHAGKR